MVEEIFLENATIVEVASAYHDECFRDDVEVTPSGLYNFLVTNKVDPDEAMTLVQKTFKEPEQRGVFWINNPIKERYKMEGEWIIAVYEKGEWTGCYEPCDPREDFSGYWEVEGTDFYWETDREWGHIYFREV